MTARADAAVAVSGDPIAALKAVTALVRARALYPAGHPMVRQTVAALRGTFEPWLEQEEAVHVDIIDGLAHFNGQPARLESQSHPGVIAEFTSLGIDSIQVTRGVADDEWLHLAIRLTVGRAHDSEPVPPAAPATGHITVGRLLPLDTRWYATDLPDGPVGPIDPDYAESLRQTDETLRAFAAGRKPDAAALRDLLQLLVAKVSRSHAALGQILAVKQYENHTYCHSVNVAILSLLLGRQIGLDDDTLAMLVEGALLHDVGKTRIPVEIIKKPSALTRRERLVIERHPSIGAAMLLEVPGLSPLTPTLALEHHRHWQGGGYPDLGAQPPHLLSQMVAIADTYEAMTGARSYRPPALPEQACLVLARLAGDRVNPTLVRAFVAAVTFFPAGTLVTTSRDEAGIVVRTSPADPLHPVVALVDPRNPSHRLGIEVDTSERDAAGGYVRHITGTIQSRRH